MRFFAGVDTHRDTHSIVVIDELGQLVDTFTIAAKRDGYAQAMSRTLQHGELIWGLEGTGSYGRPFADVLVHAGAEVYEVPGAISKRNRRRLRHRGKSDVQDAHAIAEAVLRERATLPRYIVNDAEEATRLLYERRNRQVAESTAKINRIRALALRLELELPTDMTAKHALDDLESVLAKKRPQGYAQFEVVDELRELVTDIRRILAAIAELEARMRPFVENLAPKLLELRGCSLVSAAGLIGHTGALENYRTADAFASHAGVAPVPCSSGKHVTVRVNVGGNRQLNRCLHNIANVQMRTEGHVGYTYYHRKRQEGKSHREAMRCLKRRLAPIVFRVLRASATSRAALAVQTAA